MSLIMCNINMFSQAQTIYVIRHSGEKIETTVKLMDLEDVIIDLCYTHGIKNVHLYGVHNFVTRYANKIKQKEKLAYFKNEIQVEVN